jgi:hypothetical protein
VLCSGVRVSIPVSEDEVSAACAKALGLAPEAWPTTLPPSPKLKGAAEWYEFEHHAWEIGESVRRAFVKNRRFKTNSALLTKVAEVARCRNLRRGRQSFVMALGFVAARQHAPALAEFVSDPDVDGHVVDTLLKMRAPGYARAIGSLLRSDKAWIRRLAGRYVERYPDASPVVSTDIEAV